MKRVMIAGIATAAIFGAGYLAGQGRATPTTEATNLWADSCVYRTETVYLNDNAGTATRVSALVADWNRSRGRWESVLDYAARNAVGAYDCERTY
jgi:hypothetical protein